MLKWLFLCIAALITLAHSAFGLLILTSIGNPGGFMAPLLPLPFPVFLLAFRSLRLASLGLLALLVPTSLYFKRLDVYLLVAVLLVAVCWLISALGGNLPDSEFEEASSEK